MTTMSEELSSALLNPAVEDALIDIDISNRQPKEEKPSMQTFEFASGASNRGVQEMEAILPGDTKTNV